MRYGVTVAEWARPPSQQTRLCGPSPQRLRAGRPLAVTLPDGVRTFLDTFRCRDCPAHPAFLL